MIGAKHVKATDELIALLRQDLHPSEILFFKGNRNYKLELVVKQVLNQFRITRFCL